MFHLNEEHHCSKCKYEATDNAGNTLLHRMRNTNTKKNADLVFFIKLSHMEWQFLILEDFVNLSPLSGVMRGKSGSEELQKKLSLKKNTNKIKKHKYDLTLK